MGERFNSYSTVPGTRDNHWFVPISNSELQIGRVSGDNDIFIHSTASTNELSAQVQSKFEVGQYVASVYDRKWYIGILLEYVEEYDEFLVKFMQPNGPSSTYQWPRKDDECWVPKSHLLCPISVPTTSSGRQYQIDSETTNNIIMLDEGHKLI